MNVSIIKTWWRATRPWSLTTAIIPVLLGTALAYHDGMFALGKLMAALLAGCCMLLGTNLINTYADFRSGVDTIESAVNCPELVTGQLAPEAMKKVALGFFAAALIPGAYLVATTGWVVLLLGILGIVGGYSYTAGFAFKYRGVGSIVVFLLMGLFMVCGSYYIQTGRVTLPPVLASLGIGCIVSAIMHANDFRDMQHDRAAGIVTPAVKLGTRGSLRLYQMLLAISIFAILLLAAYERTLFVYILMLAIVLPRTVTLWRQASLGYRGDGSAIRFLEVNTAKHHQLYGLVFTCVIMISGVIR